MTEPKTDPFHGIGGSYEIRNGKRVRIEEPTKPTDTGGPRDKDGNPLDAPKPAPAANKPDHAAETGKTPVSAK